MRNLKPVVDALLTALLALVAIPGSHISAQERAKEDIRRDGGVPREVAREAVALWNARDTRRSRGGFMLAAGDTLRGDVAIIGGTSRIAGVVTGQIVAINGNVILVPSGKVLGDLTVVGGALEHEPGRVYVGGEARAWGARIRYRQEADTLVLEDRDFLALFNRWRDDDDMDGTQTTFLVTSAHTYNRVEGLPIELGPGVRSRIGDTRISAELHGIFRTGNRLSWERANLGHNATFELRQGDREAIALGGRVYDKVDPVEDWGLHAGEVGLASFLFTRDYRDYWQRHGGNGYLSLKGDGGDISVSYGRERWLSRAERDVPSLIDRSIPWRINPRTDEGLINLLTLSGTYDSRNSKIDPRRGWLLHLEFERGDGVLQSVAPTTPEVRAQGVGDIQYSRGFADLRRYNRLGPAGQLNLRVVAGGWLNGDPLPLQRRFSVSGVGALPGFDFRRVIGEKADVGTCATSSDADYAALGRPAQCERMLLLQAEWKGEFRFKLFGRDERFGDRHNVINRLTADGSWVVFANSGRGWLLGDRGDLRVGTGRVPDTGTWRTDLGGGLDFGGFGFYVAQAVSQSGLSPNFFVRLSRRF